MQQDYEKKKKEEICRIHRDSRNFEHQELFITILMYNLWEC